METTRLKAARQSRGWSQMRLIAELERVSVARGVSPPTRASLKTQISRWENGHVEPDELYSSLLAEVYSTTAADLGLQSEPALWLPKPMVDGQPSSDLVESLSGVLEEYARADNAVGPGYLIGLTVQHVTELERVAMEARGSLRAQILALCSRFAEFAGWLCQDAGDVLEAERLTDRALDFVEGSDDATARAYLLMRKSAIAAERRDSVRALNLAEAAAGSDPSRFPPQLRALLARQVAIAHATVRNQLESDRAADEALEALAVGGSDAPTHLAYCTPAYVLMETGSAAARMRMYEVATDRLSGAVATWPDGFRRDHALAHARLALVEAARGNIEAACASGKDALDLATVAPSARTRAVLKALDKRLALHERSTVVSEFRSYSGEPD